MAGNLYDARWDNRAALVSINPAPRVGAGPMPTKTKTEKASAAPEVREALAEEKANQEKIGATVQAAKASATQRTPDELAVFWGSNKGMLARISEIELYSQQLERERDALQAQRDELLAAAQWALAFIDDGEGGEVEARTLRAAIARATEGEKRDE